MTLDRLIAEQARRIALLEWRLANMISHGPVVEANNEEGWVRADLNGVKSPKMPVMTQAGSVRRFAPLAEREIVTVFRPNGDARRAFAMVGGFSGIYGKPTPRGDEDVADYGASRETMRTDEILTETPTRTERANIIEDNAGAVFLGGQGGPGVARKGDLVFVSYGSSKGLHPIVTCSDVTSSI